MTKRIRKVREKLTMLVEVGSDGTLHGMINIKDGLVEAKAKTDTWLERKMKDVLRDEHDMPLVDITQVRQSHR